MYTHIFALRGGVPSTDGTIKNPIANKERTKAKLRMVAFIPHRNTKKFPLLFLRRPLNPPELRHAQKSKKK
jgi:hypothetical protein